MLIKNLAHDSRFWLVMVLSLGLLYTIERVQAYANGPWPQLVRDRERRPIAMGNTLAWFAVMILLLPGLILMLGNIAILLWQHYPRRSVQVLAGFLLALPWLVFTLGSVDQLRIAPYVRRVGVALPVVFCASLLLADFLLFFTIIDLIQTTDLVHSLKNIKSR